MKSAVRVTPTLKVQPNLPVRWLRGLLGRSGGIPEFSVRIPDLELRRSGHIAAGGPEAAQIREEIRAIKKHVLTRIQDGASAGGRNANIVLVTSALPGEGKTFVALNLALSLAIDRTLNVVLVDGDAASQGLTRKLNLTGSGGGLLDLLDRGAADAGGIVQDTNVGNLGLIPAGRARSDATELLSSSRMGNFLGSLASRSIVVLDSAGLLSGSSAAALASHSGQIVFVIGCSETKRAAVDDALTLLDQHIGPLETANVGLVLNKISSRQSPFRYSASST